MNRSNLFILTLLAFESVINSQVRSQTTSIDSTLPVVLFNHTGGYFDSSVTLSMICDNAFDSIYFTLDGSEPGWDDSLYSEPFVVGSDHVIRTRVIRNGFQHGPVTTATFYSSYVHDIPVVCLSTDPNNLWNKDSGIYVLGPSPGEYPYFDANFWQDWERPVHLELYDVQGIKRIDQDAGIKIYGAWSRTSPQKSVALFARKKYGKGKFSYKLFADRPLDKFESFILRNSGDDNMRLQFQDCFLTGLTRDMDIDRQAYQPAAVYLNGEYWGLLNIREKISNHYIENNHNVNADSVNLLERDAEIVNGTNSGYRALINYVDEKTTLQDDADYAPARDLIDMDNYIQYELSEIYFNNRDWPDNNIKFWNTNAPGSKWRWILFDTDAGFGLWNTESYEYNTLDFALEPDGPESPNPPWATLLLRRMMTNETFRNNFIIQFCDRLNLDFSPARINADLDSLQALYDKEIIYHFNRWWGSYDEWLEKIENRKTFGQYRPDYCRDFMQLRFELEKQLDVSVTVSGEGEVKINTIQPKKYPFSGVYFKDLPIRLTAIPRPGYRFVRWEGNMNGTKPSISYNMDSAAAFTAVFEETATDNSTIVINEINYASSEQIDTKDWVELYNNGLTSVDLGGWKIIDSGVDSGFIFIRGTVLAPGEYLVVCHDMADFSYFHSDTLNVVGNMKFKLSGQGEIIRLFDAENNLVDQVNYGITSPWPADACGTGKTIELLSPGLDNSLPENWHSVRTGGTPGSRNSEYVIPTNNEPVIKPDFMLTCFPNPFRQKTTVSLSVASKGHYRLEILDLQGKTIRVLAEQPLTPGSYWVDFSGEELSEGIYVIRLQGNGVIDTKKIVKIR